MQDGFSDADQAQALAAHGPELIARAWAGHLGDHDPATARQVQFQQRPGAGTSIVYSLRHGTTELFVGLTTEVLDDADGPHLRRVQLASPRGRPGAGTLAVASWLHPHDPRLPGLAHAGVASEAERLWGDGDRLTRLHTVTYRPLRRAVLRADFATPGPLVSTRRVYLKALRPAPAADLALRHRMLAAAHLPVAPLAGEVLHGVVATAAMPGESLSTTLLHDGGARLDPLALVELLDRLPDTVLSLNRKPSWADRLARYAGAAATALPERTGDIEALCSRLRGIIAARDPGPVVPVHGDFYEANVLMTGTRISGLLDLDSVGPGHRVDDLACLLGHLAVLPAVNTRYRDIWPVIERWGTAFARGVDGANLHARAAAVAISLVAGARRPGMTSWSRAAQARLDGALRLAELAG
ncbi:phosphotransferase family protein [Arthrobacter sp.]|uniref:phosphotransferase family protein n=1 Tax=Arthrobacter sp. TaxID=1667 RepID=UPI003A94C3F5